MSGSPERPEETPPPGALVTPSHGYGKIKRGNPKGTPPGPGRPPSAIREAARMGYDQRMSFLFGVVDGEMVEQKVQPPGAVEPLVIRKSADLSDRLAAMKELRAVGLGALKELSVEAVRERLEQQIRTINDDLPRLIRSMGEGGSVTVGRQVLPLETPEQVAEALLKMVEQHWR